jgi:nucleoside 2-deoxyribosyltransferase
MRLFCSNAFTGEDVDLVTKRMRKVVDTLNKSGHKAYCPIFDPHKIELQERNETAAIFEYAFDNVSKSDGMVAIISSGRKSEGQLMEIGAALALHQPVYAFIHTSAKDMPSHLKKLATKSFIWTSQEDLERALASI